MTDAARLKYLRVVLRALGVLFVFGFILLSGVWPKGWAWTTGRSEYGEMLAAVYATLGVFLWVSARDPERHKSLIGFTIWSNIVHGAVMAAQATINPMHIGHLFGDVPTLLVTAAILAYLAPSALWMRTK